MAGILRQLAREVATLAVEEPETGRCGCGEPIVQPRTGRPRKSCLKCSPRRKTPGKREDAVTGAADTGRGMTVKVRDLIAAEEALEAAEADFRGLNNDVRQWSAYESLNAQGKRVLTVTEAHFERRDAAAQRVEAARQNLLATRRAFVEEVLPNAAR